MKTKITVALSLALTLVALSGCGASYFSAKTKASYTVSGSDRTVSYESDKEENGLDAEWDEKPDGTKKVHVKVQKAGTSESAIAAAAQAQVELMKVLQQLIPLLAEAAKIGATKVP